MNVLQKLLTECIRDPEQLKDPLGLSDEEAAVIAATARKYPICIPPYYLGLIDKADKDDPIRKLCLPSTTEAAGAGAADTSGEAENTVVTGMQHKYGPTALILTTNQCSMYCRHCFRKRMVGSSADEIGRHMQEMAAYVQSHPEISNVLLSGGDALVNENETIRKYLETFSAIDSLDYIRIGTRIPAVLPARITRDNELLEILSDYNKKKQIVIVTHFNHLNEVTPEAAEAVHALLKAGCPVRNQAVLLRGVNDDPDQLAALLEKLVSIGVLPYYVFQCRPAMGVMHQFQVPLLKGSLIVESARARISGQAKQFRYVMSHETGKIEILGRMGIQYPYHFSRNELLFKYHQAKYPQDTNRIFARPVDEEQCWLD